MLVTGCWFLVARFLERKTSQRLPFRAVRAICFDRTKRDRMRLRGVATADFSLRSEGQSGCSEGQEWLFGKTRVAVRNDKCTNRMTHLRDILIVAKVGFLLELVLHQSRERGGVKAGSSNQRAVDIGHAE